MLAHIKSFMMKFAYFLLSSFVVVACQYSHRLAEEVEKQELAYKSDSTITIDMEECVVAQKRLSELISDVSYLEVEATEGSYLTLPINIKMVDSLIYVLDLDEHLRCFDRTGKFIRDGYRKGRGHGEVISLYDFDVDERFVYLLDGAKSAIVKYAHDGRFVESFQLPFRAIRFKRMYNGLYLFALAPFTLADEEESHEVVLTDSCFNIVGRYFTALGYEQSLPMVRTPYFENSAHAAFFAPVYKRGVYQLKDSVLFMKYYLDFKKPYFEPSRKVKGELEAKEKGLFYTYWNPIHTQDYLVQNFYTSENAKGLFVMDLHHNRPMFIKEVVNDMDNVVRFNFDFTKFYDVRQDLFASVTDVYFKGIHTEEEIEEGTSHLSDSVRSILVRAKGEEGINPILMFYRLKKDIVK